MIYIHLEFPFTMQTSIYFLSNPPQKWVLSYSKWVLDSAASTLSNTSLSPCSSSVGRVWLCVRPPGSGSRPEIRSEAHCLAGKTRIIFLTFAYLHATMRKDRMSKLKKNSTYNEKNTSICSMRLHLHRLNEPDPLRCACICLCVFDHVFNRLFYICVS